MTSLEILVEDVKKTVHPYGQYFSLQDVSEDSQPFMVPDFAMYAALIVFKPVFSSRFESLDKLKNTFRLATSIVVG